MNLKWIPKILVALLSFSLAILFLSTTGTIPVVETAVFFFFSKVTPLLAVIEVKVVVGGAPVFWFLFLKLN